MFTIDLQYDVSKNSISGAVHKLRKSVQGAGQLKFSQILNKQNHYKEEGSVLNCPILRYVICEWSLIAFFKDQPLTDWDHTY